MAGPLPKRAATRQRRNKSATSAKLQKPDASSVVVPPLPEATEGTSWHPLTLRWWSDTWHSPMAPEFDESDVHGLFILATLVDAFWYEPNAALAAEIRLQRQCFGLTPIDRRRLQWEIERAEEAQEKGRKRSQPASPATGKGARKAQADPRKRLSVVQ
jgi:hypothetical protein